MRHIAASPLLTCSAAEDLHEVLGRPEFRDIDQIPITEAGRITGIWEHSEHWNRRTLDDSVLVSGDAPLWHFIHTVHDQPFRLVVIHTAISGIVTWSDLLKVPVLMLAFSLVAELELTMNQRITEHYAGTDEWISLLGTEDAKRIEGRHRKLVAENLNLPKLELADLVHKAKVLRLILASGRVFEQDLERVASLRNDVDHVKNIVRSRTDLKRFVQRLETAEHWLHILQNSENPVFQRRRVGEE